MKSVEGTSRFLRDPGGLQQGMPGRVGVVDSYEDLLVRFHDRKLAGHWPISCAVFDFSFAAVAKSLANGADCSQSR